MLTPVIIEKFKNIPTPFYYYNMELLCSTLEEIKEESSRYNYIIHYAIKANANRKILNKISEMGFGADCVSGNEVQRALETGFRPEKIVYAGVGKSDAEIQLALKANIFCFNCESIAELKVIDELAAINNRIARVALRINPDVNAQTHQYITTGVIENKFGINILELEKVVALLKQLSHVELIGLHFHIGSQITNLEVFKNLCLRVNEIQKWFIEQQIDLQHINVGGGFGVDYNDPVANPISDFRSYFTTFHKFLELYPGQQVHFELGRSVVAQCGSLIAKVLYIKNGMKTQFAILDAGMTELLRPALYQTHHKIQNLTSTGKLQTYDVVGPICETSDCFGKSVMLPKTQRHDLIAIRSAGAYGNSMASRYNLRDIAKSVFSDEL